MTILVSSAQLLRIVEFDRAFASGPGRTKGIIRPADARPLPKVAWSMTIADVAAQMHDADSYCRLIEKWAKTILQEMGPLIETP
jgi:hypothetical protein